MDILDRLRTRRWALPLARAAWFIACLAVFIAAVIPREDHPPDLFGWDKANHFFAFYVLSLLAAAAFPRASPIILAAWMSGFGAAIEGVQAIPFIHRDCDINDWIADSAGVLAALVPLLVARWRTGFRIPPPS
jgi:VanZ family protein